MKHYDKLIFVSGSDTATSPMAEAILSRIFQLEDILILSKGLVALFPEPINPKAEAVLVSHNLPMKDHMSDQLQDTDFDDRTLILTMTRGEKDRLLRDFSNPMNVFSLTEYILGEEEIEDPYGGSVADYGKYFDRLTGQIERLAGILRTEDGGAVSQAPDR